MAYPKGVRFRSPNLGCNSAWPSQGSRPNLCEGWFCLVLDTVERAAAEVTDYKAVAVRVQGLHYGDKWEVADMQLCSLQLGIPRIGAGALLNHEPDNSLLLSG